jgi:hypothetical protein
MGINYTTFIETTTRFGKSEAVIGEAVTWVLAKKAKIVVSLCSIS